MYIGHWIDGGYVYGPVGPVIGATICIWPVVAG
jgi:hypothetical protein